MFTQPYTRLGTAAPPSLKTVTVPASVGGVNALSSLMQMPGEDCIYTFNLMPAELGLRLRKGYQEWATGIIGDVRTIVSYEGREQSDDRLWAATEYGIYDVTTFGETIPDEAQSFSINGVDSGYGVQAEFVNDAAVKYLFYADSENGLFQYSSVSGLWTVPPSGILDTDWYYIDGGRIAFPVDEIAFITVHKLRIWVILRDSSDAWYLPLYQFAGELKKFTFGAKMVHGGNLMGLWTWSMDGGEGMDDYLIAVSRSGDVMVYKGDDPETTSTVDPVATGPWTLIGTWFIGAVPASRRIAIGQGSEMYLLSSYGITSLRDLLQGSTANDTMRSLSAKVNRFLRADIKSGRDRHEWSLNVNPADGFLQIVTPEPNTTPYVQYNQNLTTKAWGFWEDVPLLCGKTWNGEYYMGGKDGVVYWYNGVLDNIELTPMNRWYDLNVDFVNDDPAYFVNDDRVEFLEGFASGGPEWTVPNPLEYQCDGTQVSTTDYTVIATLPVIGDDYIITYTITNWVAGQHWVMYGGAITPASVGDGVFTATITAINADLTASIFGSETFEGIFSLIDIVPTYSTGTPIGFRTLTSFQGLDNHAAYKIAGFIRTVGLRGATPNLNVKAVFDYYVDVPITAPPPQAIKVESLWDSAIWDSSTWDVQAGGAPIPIGALGMGRAVAIGMRGNSATRITVVGWDYMYQLGGLL